MFAYISFGKNESIKKKKKIAFFLTKMVFNEFFSKNRQFRSIEVRMYIVTGMRGRYGAPMGKVWEPAMSAAVVKGRCETYKVDGRGRANRVCGRGSLRVWRRNLVALCGARRSKVVVLRFTWQDFAFSRSHTRPKTFPLNRINFFAAARKLQPYLKVMHRQAIDDNGYTATAS